MTPKENRQPPAGIQQGHVQHHDVHPLLLGEQPPLLQDLPIVAPQTVDALDVEQIVFFQFPHQPPVLGAKEVLAGLLVQQDVALRHARLPQGDPLAVFILFPGADPDVAVNSPDPFHNLPLSLLCRCDAALRASRPTHSILKLHALLHTSLHQRGRQKHTPALPKGKSRRASRLAPRRGAILHS